MGAKQVTAGSAASVAGSAAREKALALAQEKLKAKKREQRQKSSLVLTVSALAFFIPAALLAGADLSGLFYAPPPPAEPVTIHSGDNVTLRIQGTLDNQTVFWPDGERQGTLGDGTFVAGLEKGIIGFGVGASFNITVLPQDGYGNWSKSRTSTVASISVRSRNTTLELG